MHVRTDSLVRTDNFVIFFTPTSLGLVCLTMMHFSI
jgi:hypothetical protein